MMGHEIRLMEKHGQLSLNYHCDPFLFVAQTSRGSVSTILFFCCQSQLGSTHKGQKSLSNKLSVIFYSFSDKKWPQISPELALALDRKIYLTPRFLANNAAYCINPIKCLDALHFVKGGGKRYYEPKEKLISYC